MPRSLCALNYERTPTGVRLLCRNKLSPLANINTLYLRHYKLPARAEGSGSPRISASAGRLTSVAPSVVSSFLLSNGREEGRRRDTLARTLAKQRTLALRRERSSSMTFVLCTRDRNLSTAPSVVFVFTRKRWRASADSQISRMYDRPMHSSTFHRFPCSSLGNSGILSFYKIEATSRVSSAIELIVFESFNSFFNNTIRNTECSRMLKRTQLQIGHAESHWTGRFVLLFFANTHECVAETSATHDARDLDFRECLFFITEFPRREQHDSTTWPARR